MSGPVPSNFASPMKTQEEEDHLVRSTKKIKSKDHLETMDTTESSSIPPPALVHGPDKVSIEGQKVKSFKEALAAPRNADFYFDDSMDSLSADEEEEEGDAPTHEENLPIGKPLKIDLTTAMATRGRFARVCVKVDLRKPLCPRFLLGKKSYNIEYESIHSFCFYCGRVDHRKELCKYQAAHPKPQIGHRNNPLLEGLQLTVESNHVQTSTASPNANGHLQQSEVEGEDTYGPWMMVTKRTCKPVINRKTQPIGPSPTHNKFSELSKGTH
ncbi:hypothetical protein LOK49_LG06G01910 [Camellia lanceoleosa]|uniref:Uncharacterized protein n=1 Tax=Camellia lanceoleosa TaxID=1840588 RepID=A0ACC0H987_9ERIC|nr:hypothetical protein LOK49_LG06G01910 [Camellia lanceoleosa]